VNPDKDYRIHLGYYSGHNLDNNPAAYCNVFTVNEHIDLPSIESAIPNNSSANDCIIAGIEAMLLDINQYIYQHTRYGDKPFVSGLLSVTFIHKRKFAGDVLKRVIELLSLFERLDQPTEDTLRQVGDNYFNTLRNKLKTQQHIIDISVMLWNLRIHFGSIIVNESYEGRNPHLMIAMIDAKSLTILQTTNIIKGNFG